MFHIDLWAYRAIYFQELNAKYLINFLAKNGVMITKECAINSLNIF